MPLARVSTRREVIFCPNFQAEQRPPAPAGQYLQFLHQLVVVGDRLGESLEELLLSLELATHGSSPPVPLLRRLGLADVGDGRALPAGGPHSEHSGLGV